MRLLVSGCTSTMAAWAMVAPDLFGHLTSPRARNKLGSLLADGLPWAIDNGAYSGFDPVAFRGLLFRARTVPGCLFVVVPDVVRDARLTLELFGQWRAEVQSTGHPVAFVAQDGCEDTAIPWDHFEVLFVGGSDEWRFSRQMVDVVSEARRRGKRLHFGRVNSLVRVQIAWDLGCDTLDGTGFSWFGEHYIPAYVRWVRSLQSQQVFFPHPCYGLRRDHPGGPRSKGLLEVQVDGESSGAAESAGSAAPSQVADG